MTLKRNANSKVTMCAELNFFGFTISPKRHFKKLLLFSYTRPQPVLYNTFVKAADKGYYDANNCS